MRKIFRELLEEDLIVYKKCNLISFMHVMFEINEKKLFLNSVSVMGDFFCLNKNEFLGIQIIFITFSVI